MKFMPIINFKFKQIKKGSAIVYILVFGVVFLIIFSSFINFFIIQFRQTNQKVFLQTAFEIAEAGIEYYKWCLNNGVESNCSTTKDYLDSEGQKIGQFSLSINRSQQCGQTLQTEIISTGQLNKQPQIKKTIKALYGRESVGKFSYILNSAVWIGADHQILGPYHSNNGIRMDGANQSVVSSAQETWICTESFGCESCKSPCNTVAGKCVCPGVFTTENGNPDLFEFPVPIFNFNQITFDLSQMKAIAQSSGIYLPPSNTINSSAKGYHLIFKNDGNVEIRIITSLSSDLAYSMEEGWHTDYFRIKNEYVYYSTSVPSSCSLIFVEDNLWPEGTIKGKVALASATVSPSSTTDVVLPNSINYSSLNGSDSFLLISERNVLIGPQSPDYMTLRGIYIAQTGRFARNCYPSNKREELKIYGTVVSNGRVGTLWHGGSCDSSGYQNRYTYFDSNLIFNAENCKN